MARTSTNPLDGAGLVVVDKPAGLTSHDVVGRMRRFFRTRRVGHAGTLDPMATGVLLIGIERVTKILGQLQLETKAYTATVRLGTSTTTDDREGDVLSTAEPAALAAVSDEALSAAIAELTGEIMQVPASVSAIKVDGRRAYDRVRAGEDVRLDARPVTIESFAVLARRDFLEEGAIDVDVEVACSSGTYIRSLARDLGEALGVGGHLTALRRTRVGPIDLSEAATLEEWEARAEEAHAAERTPTPSLSLDETTQRLFPCRQVSAEEAEGLTHGRWLETVGQRGVACAVDPEGRSIALIKEKGRRASSVVVLRPAGLSASPRRES